MASMNGTEPMVVITVMEEGRWAHVGSATRMSVGWQARVLDMVSRVPATMSVAVSMGPCSATMAAAGIDGSMGPCQEAEWRQRMAR